MENEKNGIEESKAESWTRRFSEWEENGLPQLEFCKTRGVSLSGFRYWCSRLAEVSPRDMSSRTTVRIHVGGNVVEADAFRVYKIVAGEEPGVTRVGCWAHVRRRFFEATKGSRKAGAAHEGLGFVRALYRIQDVLCSLNLSDDEFLRRRREANLRLANSSGRAASCRPQTDDAAQIQYGHCLACASGRPKSDPKQRLFQHGGAVVGA